MGTDILESKRAVIIQPRAGNALVGAAYGAIILILAVVAVLGALVAVGVL